MKPSLYQKLQELSKDDIKERMRLDALHATLDHFNLDAREICAEAILRLEQIVENNDVVPADEAMKRLMTMYHYFKGESNV